MAYATEPLIYEKFRGIREYNGVNYGGEISAIECKNVELVQTEIGDKTGIRSMQGNKVVYALPDGYSVVGIFKSVQEDITYKFIYAENDSKGTLFYIDLADNVSILVDNLTKTGKCNGLTMSSTAYDVFVFTNGKEVKTLCFTSDVGYETVVKDHNFSKVEGTNCYVAEINAVDYQGRAINWLSMTNWNGFLVVASKFGVHSSHQSDIYKWNDDPKDVADSWYIDFSKKITAVYSFTGGLYIFTEDDCSLLNTTPNDAVNSKLITSAGIGCHSYESLVKHDLYLFFYDNNQKNIYYLQATDTTGQIRPSGAAAKEIQSYFSRIDKFKMFSCIYENKNEVWCLINDNILIFNYVQGEWLTRQEQNIESLALIDNTIYTGGTNGVIYVENINEDFSGGYYPSVYQTTFINVSSNTNLKKQKTPLLLTLNANFVNDFYVQLIVDNKEKNAKHIKVSQNATGIFATIDGESVDVRTMFANIYGENEETGEKATSGAKFSPENTYRKTVVEVSTPQTWYTMGIKIFTDKLGQGFYISSMELKNIKVKTKTRGR